MARDFISTATNDLISDKGSILLSLVRGEQFEFPIICDFLAVADDNLFTFEAVVMEGVNDGKGTIPTAVQQNDPGPPHVAIHDTLAVRVPEYKGEWDPADPYDTEDVVDYNEKSYKMLLGDLRISSVTPDKDDYWIEHDKRTIYVQFPSTFCITAPSAGPYLVLPQPDKPVYGFFELSVAENSNPIFSSIWKPARGLIQILFSPTLLV